MDRSMSLAYPSRVAWRASPPPPCVPRPVRPQQVDVDFARYQLARLHGAPGEREMLEALYKQRVDQMAAKIAQGPER